MGICQNFGVIVSKFWLPLNIHQHYYHPHLADTTKKYKEFCSLYGLNQVITSPTHVTENTSAILHHVLTNSQDWVSQSGVIGIGLSDHQLLYCTRKIVRRKVYEHNIRSLKIIHRIHFLMPYGKSIFQITLNSMI